METYDEFIDVIKKSNGNLVARGIVTIENDDYLVSHERGRGVFFEKILPNDKVLESDDGNKKVMIRGLEGVENLTFNQFKRAITNENGEIIRSGDVTIQGSNYNCIYENGFFTLKKKMPEEELDETLDEIILED